MDYPKSADPRQSAQYPTDKPIAPSTDSPKPTATAHSQAHHQPGIATPSGRHQPRVLLVQINLLKDSDGNAAADVAAGLQTLGAALAELNAHSDTTHFSVTLGLGIGFFDAARIAPNLRPRGLRAMPEDLDSHLGDKDWLITNEPLPSDPTQLTRKMGRSVAASDLILILAGPDDDSVWEPLTDRDDSPGRIPSALSGWAEIFDIHFGFRRANGRNMLGFLDGLSNPHPDRDDPREMSLFNQVVWTTTDDEDERLVGGTYLVFEKIAHDLDQWQLLGRPAQQQWLGRFKDTGLLLGTHTDAKDQELYTTSRQAGQAGDDARAELKQLLRRQSDPLTPLSSLVETRHDCPIWSHARRANPRMEDGTTLPHLIYRRGANYVEGPKDLYPSRVVSGQSWPKPLPDALNARSGILFLAFQRSLSWGFEHIKRAWLNNERFPVPAARNLDEKELEGILPYFGGLTVADALDHDMDDLVRPLLSPVAVPAAGMATPRGPVQAPVANALPQRLSDTDRTAIREKFGTRNLRDVFPEPVNVTARAGHETNGDPTESTQRPEAHDPLKEYLRKRRSGREALGMGDDFGRGATPMQQVTFPLGGGYYFIPPLLGGDTHGVSALFFESASTLSH